MAPLCNTPAHAPSTLFTTSTEVEVVNLTAHEPTPAQVEMGVTESLLRGQSFANVGADADMDLLCKQVQRWVFDNLHDKDPSRTFVMVGGHFATTTVAVATIRDMGFVPVIAHSERVSVDIPQPDGSVRKVAEFRHKGWFKLP